MSFSIWVFITYQILSEYASNIKIIKSIRFQNIRIHILLYTHSLNDEEGGGHVVDDVQHHQHLLLLADRLDEENT